MAASLTVGPAASQLLDGTLDDVVDRQIAEQVENDVTQALEDVVEQQVEAGITEQVQEDVAGAVEQQIESEVVDGIQQVVEAGVVADIATQVESTVGAEIGEQLLDAVGGDIGDVAQELEDTARGVAGGAAENAAAEDSRGERFAADVDALGRAIERQVWIILVPAEHAERIADWGFTIRERQDLGALGRVLLRVAAPEDRDIAQAALELALDAPGTTVDFNHIYRPGAEEPTDSVTGRPAVAAGAMPEAPAPALTVGIVDTAVSTQHDSLRAADIVQRDFVPFAGERPTAHGTAVASILVGDAARLRPQFLGGRVYAASVFFADAEGNDATTAASLTVAGEWLLAQGVSVMNMSLAGPPNRVLEAAIAALVARGVVVVAAVGNNGPHGAPLYPAAYPDVVGVTAIDRARRVYRYANRGPHVTFAAVGVDVAVAKSGGGYGELTGTSFAAPHVAAAIARAVASRSGTPSATVVAELKRTAVDLGAQDFDDVFGFGVIAPPTPVTASR